MTKTRTIIVGDIHGMLGELTALLKASDFNADTDRLVAVGDLIHKGPDSAGVVSLMRSLGAELVRGNHEDQQARYRNAIAKAKDPSKVKMKNTEELAEIEASLSDEDREYLETAKLFLAVPGGIVVHGGILPTLEALPTDEEMVEMSKGELAKLGLLMRTRYVRGIAQTKVSVEFNIQYDADVEESQGLTTAQVMELMADALSAVVTKKKVRPYGEFISLGKERDGVDPYWADVYDGRFGHVFFGHEPFIDEETPVDYPHATALDLGAVFGGRLAAVIIEEGRAMRAVTVEATEKYADPKMEDE